MFSSQRWARLQAHGANVQRPLWASTGVKDPSLPDTLYVTGLVAPNTVNTMPEATLNAVADHGEITGNTIMPNYSESNKVLDAIGAAGVSYTEVVEKLEIEGLSKFDVSWEEVLQTVRKALEQARQPYPLAADIQQLSTVARYLPLRIRTTSYMLVSTQPTRILAEILTGLHRPKRPREFRRVRCSSYRPVKTGTIQGTHLPECGIPPCE